MNLIESLNIEYIKVNDDELEAKMNLTKFHDNTYGYLNGGATIAFGEIIGGYASIQIIDDDELAVGQSVNANHMKPKKIEGYIIAKGKLMHKGRMSHVWNIEMIDQNNVLISHVTVSNAIIKGVR
ncbi:PaaI family thioesterase [Oceanirhabdus sp. W0125-5]|uniref:PaaI family thioesterase n=1 Tax=Oceanirhabdus sp. W0125-5 TaxID=2999116 RepID=UPI0022F2ED35|nr:PaaI family thioesterase [Oceanirhabdus sp. W0125-5]WBW97243.1 PaaI family thioesterase [Oceanirhabdus sp. W0125-5]